MHRSVTLVLVACALAGCAADDVTSRDFAVGELNLTANPSDAITSSTTIRFTFGAQGATRYKCALDGAPLAPCRSGVTLTGVAPGSHQYAVSAYDAAGHVIASDTWVWTVGGALAVTSVTHPDGHTIVVQTTSNVAAALSCSLDGGAAWSCGNGTFATLQVPDPGHGHTLTVSGVGAYGPTNRVTVSLDVLLILCSQGATAGGGFTVWPCSEESVDYFYGLDPSPPQYVGTGTVGPEIVGTAGQHDTIYAITPEGFRTDTYHYPP